MQSNLKPVLAAGLATTLLTAYCHALLNTLIGFSPYNITLAMIVPIGALVCGFLAMSGFYFAAKRNEGLARPLPVLLAAMVAAAVLGQFLMYGFEYHGAFIPGMSLADALGFGDYLAIVLNNATIEMRGQTFENESGAHVALMASAQAVVFVMASVIAYKQLPGSGGFLDD